VIHDEEERNSEIATSFRITFFDFGKSRVIELLLCLHLPMHTLTPLEDILIAQDFQNILLIFRVGLP
jgi:hypothetical protein